MAEELEVLAEGVDLPHEGKPDVPPASNIVWDFALGIQHSVRHRMHPANFMM
jgi:hypothetical protein